jgi:type 1 glutamine amidotransferase
MKAMIACTLALGFLGVPSLTAEENAQPVRVLLTFGGHGFEQEAFFGMFDDLDGVVYTKAELPKDARLLHPDLRKTTDVVVMYDMVPKISADQQKAFLALLNQGIGVVSLHHNLGAHRDWDEYVRVIGGKFVFQDEVLEGTPYTKSTWSHGEDLRVQVVAPEHPITRGIKDFTIHDESYGGFYTASGVQVLLKTDHPKNDPELAWTTTYGNSRVFYLMLGHDHLAWENPSFVRLLRQGILWAAERDGG